MSTTYMTARLKLKDGTIIFPQVSADNMVLSISDHTDFVPATLENGTVPITQLPTTIAVTSASAPTEIPTALAVWNAIELAIEENAASTLGDNLVLPPKHYAVVGRECNIYYDNLYKCQGSNFNTDINGAKGTAQNERYTITPAEAATLTLHVNVRNIYSCNIMGTQDTTLYIASSAAGSGQTIGISMIGDSLVQSGAITGELLTISSTDVLQLTLIGTRGSGDNRHEGRGGWTIGSYTGPGPTYFSFDVSGVQVEPAINSTTYTTGGSEFRVQEVHLTGGAGTIVCQKLSGSDPSGSGTLTKSNAGAGDASIAFTSVSGVPANPFWINGKVDYAGYLSTNSLALPDAVFILLGTNDVFGSLTDEAVVATATTAFSNLDTLIASIKQAGVSIVGLMLTCPPAATQDAFGANYFAGRNRDRVKRNYAVWVEELIKKYGNSESQGIYLVPVNTGLDTVHNFAYAAAAPANSRTTMTVTRQNNGVHPATSGYQQIADVTWAFIKNRIDFIASYRVITATGTEDGSLYYGLSSSNPTSVIRVSAALNGTPLELNGASPSAPKTVIGNGSSNTALTGALTTRNDTQLEELALSDVTITGGTLHILDGVTVSGGTLSVNANVRAVFEGGSISPDGTVRKESSQTYLYPLDVNGSGGAFDFCGNGPMALPDSVVTDKQWNMRNVVFKNANGGSYAGALLVRSGVTATIESCVFSGCSSVNGGAITTFSKGVVDVSATTFTNCYAPTGGAYTGNRGGVATFTSCTFSGCSAGAGAGLNIEGYSSDVGTVCSAICSDCVFTDLHHTGQNGGAATVYGNTTGRSYVKLVNTVISSCISDVTSGRGTALFNNGGIMEVSSCTITGCTAGGRATALYQASGTTIIRDSLIESNWHTASAGYTLEAYYDSVLELYNTTVANNTDRMGGIYAAMGSGSLVLSSCTVTSNGYYNMVTANGANVLIKDSVLSGGVGANAVYMQGGNIRLDGVNEISNITHHTSYPSGTIVISSGASINLIGKLVPGSSGGITIMPGGCTINGTYFGDPVESTVYTQITSSGGSTTGT